MAASKLSSQISMAELIYRIQYSLIDQNSCSAAQLFTASSFLSRSDYQDIVIERSIVGICGNPNCPNNLPVNRIHGGRFRIALGQHRVYDLEETYKFCSEDCVIRSRTFFNNLGENRVFDLNEAKIERALRIFGNGNDGEKELGDGLRIKEKDGAGEVCLDEWIGPANAIEGYVPQRDRVGDFGLNFIPQRHSRKGIVGAGDSGLPFSSSSLLVGKENGEILSKESSDVKPMIVKKRDASTSEKNIKSKKTALKTSKVKSKKNSDDYGSRNVDLTSSVIFEDEFDDHNALSLKQQEISEMLAKQLENIFLEEKRSSKKEGISKSFRFKHHEKLEAAKNEKLLSKEINGELVDVHFGKESDKAAFSISNCGDLSQKKTSLNESIAKKLEDKISSEKKTISEEKLLKSCLKTSGSRVIDQSVKWADENKDTSLVEKMTIPQNSFEEHLDRSIRCASADVCTAALIQAGESVVSGKAEVGDAEAGNLILPHSQALPGESEDAEDIFELDRGIVKWPTKTVLLDTDMFEVEDSWHDAPPEGFNLNLSPFATMWMALFGWISCSSLAYIYGHDEHSYENFMVVNEREYPRQVALSDGQSLEIRQTLDGFICRLLPVVVRDLSILVPVSTLEKFMGCLISTMSFMDAIPSFKSRQWHAIVLLFIEALSVHRLVVLAPHLMSRGTQIQQILSAAQISFEQYETMRDLILPLGRSTDFPIMNTE